jgi:uncharacterized protein YndB with AHSA1/START domain
MVTETGTDDGELEREGDRAIVRYTRRFPSAPQKVWPALTDPGHLVAWFPTTIDGRREAGAPLHFGFRDMEGPPFEGEMVHFDPPTVMELRWGDETLRFELRPEDDGSVLALTVRFDEIGKAARDGAGWHSCLDLLTHQVAGATAPWSAADRWKQVRLSSVERFGPEASTVGPPEGWERVHGSGPI